MRRYARGRQGGRNFTSDTRTVSTSYRRIIGFQLFNGVTLAAVDQDSECWFTEFSDETSARPKSLLLEEKVPTELAKLRTVTGCAIDANDNTAVCSPAGGAVYGVNRETYKLKWKFRYKPIEDFIIRVAPVDDDRWRFSRSRVAQVRPNRWQFSLVQIVGDVAIVAPADSNELFCLDLTGGKIKWKLPRSEALYAQVAGDSVVVVGAKSLRVLQLADGKPVVEPISLPGKDRTSGRGCWKDGDYLLPVSTNAILRFDLKKGKIIRRYLVASKPGNLTTTEVGVVSQSAVTIAHYSIR